MFQTAEKTPVLLTKAEVAKQLRVSERTIDRLGDRIPGRRKIGSKVLFLSDELQAWLAAGMPEAPASSEAK